ncbi:MAG: ABC transporter substrate-binding protein [Rhodospirillaceae bacterium]|nr:ABC transporter substrate-binding protein [Rhodospirillaceae bacterium]MCA8930830.1 ABC transporter substrate-binding protein [Rhodospirillaceae bacterium]
MRLMSSTAAISALILLAANPANAEIRIGSVLSVTGPASFLGDPELKTLEMLVEELNANGGINGEEVVLIHYDDGGDANTARTLATRLVEDDEVVAVVGGSTTGVTLAVAPVFEENEIPFISMAGAVSIIDPVNPWVFKTPHTDRMACESIYTDLNARGLTSIGLISGQGGFGASMREQCIDVAPDYGITIVADETYGPRDSDMTPQLTSIAATDGIQAIVNPGFGQGPAIVTRNYAQLGIDLPLYQSHGVASDAFIELAGDAANGVRLPGSATLVVDLLPDDDPQHDVVTAYRDAYVARYNEPVSTFGGYAYDAFWLMVNAIEAAGTTDGEAVREAIENTTGWVGVTGIFNMTPEDHMGLDLSAFRMLEIVDGHWTLVE